MVVVEEGEEVVEEVVGEAVEEGELGELVLAVTEHLSWQPGLLSWPRHVRVWRPVGLLASRLWPRVWPLPWHVWLQPAPAAWPAAGQNLPATSCYGP